LVLVASCPTQGVQKDASDVVVPLIIPQSVLTREIDSFPIASIVALHKCEIDEICQPVLFLLQQNSNFSIPPVFCGIVIAVISVDTFAAAVVVAAVVVRLRASGTAGPSCAILADGSVLGASRSLGSRQ
jgi:hypothetical protein